MVKKIKTIHIIFFISFLVISASLFRWQIIYADAFKKIAEGRIYSTELKSLRGSIYSKDGTTLAYSEPRFDMFVWIKDLEYFEDKHIQTRQEFIKKIAPVIDKTPGELSKLIDENYKEQKLLWFPIAESISSKQWEEILELTTDNNSNAPLRGFRFISTSKRIYPEERLASHILGLTNLYKDNEIGRGGIEGYWNGELNPRKGIEIKENDAIGQAVANSLFATIEPKPGSSIYTTIDKKLQKIIEEKVKDSVEQFEAESGTIIVMDPKTGGIMAMSNYPDYNPNLREEVEPSVYTNQAISIPYEVGSIGKVFTFAAAIDKGVITPDTIIQPQGHEGCEKFTDDLEPLCTSDKKPQPPLSALDCFAKSDNICFYHILHDFIMDLDKSGDDVNKKDSRSFYSYLNDFGIGKSTGLDLTGEGSGVLKNGEDWNLGDVAAFSYGHGYLTTPIQAVSAVSVIPNKGFRMKPYVMEKVIKGDGEVLYFQPFAINFEKEIIKPQTADLVGNIMHKIYLRNIPDYEHWYSDLKNYNIGMKSGTGLIATATRYGADVNSTQVGFDMSSERTFIMLVKLTKPKGGHLSYYNSRVMWLDTFAAIKDHLNVPRINEF